MTGTAVETLFRRNDAVVLAALVTLVAAFLARPLRRGRHRHRPRAVLIAGGAILLAGL
jgi:hypothetical protein